MSSFLFCKQYFLYIIKISLALKIISHDETIKKKLKMLNIFKFRKGMKNFILIDADIFIKKHFITKEKTDLTSAPYFTPSPLPKKFPRCGMGATNKIFWDKTSENVWIVAVLTTTGCTALLAALAAHGALPSNSLHKKSALTSPLYHTCSFRYNELFLIWISLHHLF